jgi:hypothetical protein
MKKIKKISNNMKRDKKLIKDDLTNILKPYHPFTDDKKINKAFRALIMRYPEGVRYVSFYSAVSGRSGLDTAVTALTEIISDDKDRVREHRIDADADYLKRKRTNYKGRKRSDLWSVLEKAYKIITYKHIDEWKRDFGIDKTGWNRLHVLMSMAIDINNIAPFFAQLDTIPEVAKDRYINELLILWESYYLFIRELNKAIKRNNKDDKTFLSTVADIWRKKTQFILPEGFEIKRRGKRLNKETRDKRINSVLAYLKQKGKQKNQRILSGDFYSRDFRTFICYLANKAYNLIRIIDIIRILDREKEIERLDEQLRLAQRRAEALEDIRSRVDQYKFTPSEIFNLAPRPHDLTTLPPATVLKIDPKK